MSYILCNTAAPVVITHPISSTINSSQTATFACVFTGYPPPNVTWERNGNLLQRGSRIQIHEMGNSITGRTSTLTVTDTTVEDTGNYICNASNSRGYKLSDSVLLTVQGMTSVCCFTVMLVTILGFWAVKPTVVAVMSSIVVREGRTATFTVNITTAIPTVLNSAGSRKWQFPNGSTITSNTRYIFSSDFLTLSIHTVTSADHGVYTFQSSNVVGVGKVTITLSVTSGMHNMAMGFIYCH